MMEAEQKRKRGAPVGNKNAVGNKGGPGGLPGNQNARGRGKLQRTAAKTVAR